MTTGALVDLGSRPATADCWQTPAPVLSAARAALGGHFDLDPASCPEANDRVRATRFYTPDDDGLIQPWNGRVWLNPPYSRPDPWIAKLRRDPGVEAFVAVLPERLTGLGWGRTAVESARVLCVPRGRIAFIRPGQVHPDPGPNFGCLLVAGGPALQVRRAVRALRQLGACFVPA